MTTGYPFGHATGLALRKTGRNEPCPCGSGRKYKHCCLVSRAGEDHQEKKNAQRYLRKHNIILKTPEQIQGMRRAGRLVIDLLDRIEPMLVPGLETQAIDDFVNEYSRAHHAIPAPLNYRGFPKSCCISINEVVCHGVPGPRRLREGDIVNVDVTPVLDGYYADANKTYFVGTPSPEARKVVHVARESLRLGLEQVRPGNTVGDIGWAIQHYAEAQNCSVVRDYVGHGVGLKFHERPDIPHYGKRGKGITLVKGMTFTIEPMINLGTKALHVLDDGWTAITNDGSLSAQFEQTILVTETGCEVLTPYDLCDPL